MADDNYKLQGLEIDIKSDDKQAMDSLDGVIAKLEKMKSLTRNKGLERTAQQLERLANSFDGISKTIRGLVMLEDVAENLEKLSNIKISATVARQITNIGTALGSIKTEDVEKIKTLADSLGAINGAKVNIKVGTATAKAAKSATENITQAVAKTSGMETASVTKGGTPEIPKVALENEEIAKSSDDVSSAVSKATAVFSGFKNVISQIPLGNILSFLKRLGSVFKTVGSAALSATKQLMKFVAKMTLIPTIGSKLASTVQTFTSKIGQFFASIKRIAFYRLLRTLIKSITSGFKEGMENLYQYSLIMGTEFAPNMDRIATSLLYLKNSLGALTDPIVARLAPAIDLLVDKFVDLLNIVNQVISTLNGETTYTAAKKYATTWAEAADDTKAAIDEIKRYVLGFDELNILGKKNNGKGSADSNALDYSQMFEERAVSTAVSSFVDKIKAAFKQKDFINLGRMIGTWINKGISQIPDYAIGIKIGTTVNDITETLYGLFDEIKSEQLGQKIGTNIAAAVKTIKWDRVGVTAGTFTNRIIDFYHGIIMSASLGDIGAGLGTMFANAVGTIDWQKAAYDVGETVNQIGDFISNLITKAKLGNLGEDIADFINKAVKTVDWAEKGRNLAETFNGIIAFFKNLILKTDFKLLGGSLGTFFTNAVKNVKWKNLGITAAKILTGVADFFIGFISHTDFKEVGKAVGSAIKSFLKTLNDWFAKQDFVQLGKDILNGVVEFVEGLDVGNIIYQIGLALWNLLKAAVEVAFGIGLGIGDKIVEWGKSIGQWFSEGWDEVVGDLFDFGDKETMSESGKAFAKGFVGIMEATPLWDYLKEQQAAKDKIKDALAAASATGFGAAESAYYQLNPVGIVDIASMARQVAQTTGYQAALISSLPIANLSYSDSMLAAGEAREANSELSDLHDIEKAIRYISFFSPLPSGGFGTLLNWDTMQKSFREMFTDYKTEGFTGQLSDSMGLTANVSSVSLLDSAKLDLAEGIAAVYTKNDVKSVGIADAAKSALISTAAQIALKGNMSSISINAAKAGLTSAVAGIALSGIMTKINPAGAKTGLQSTVKSYSLDGTVTHFSPTKKAWGEYSSEVKDYGLTGTITHITIANAAKAAAANALAVAVSIGGMATGGIINHGHTIPMYAGGTTKAHGTLFMAGENGSEIVGNVNGRTEILNRSQMAQAMYAAAVSGMSTIANAMGGTFMQGASAIIEAFNNDDGGNMTALVDGVREGVYEATAAQNELLRQQNDILLDLLAKDNTTEITTNSVVKALSRKNRRDGKYVVPVGVT